MAIDASTTSLLAPLEAHAETQVKHLLAIADVVRELQTAEALHANEYSSLLFQIPAESKQTLEQLPQLRRVCDGFSLLLSEIANVKSSLAAELSKEVLEPLEDFTTEHGEKARHLLSELYELLQREKAFDLAYQQLHDLSSQEDSSSGEDDDHTQQQHTHAQQLRRKRDAERHTIQQWITALHFADQRYETQVRGVVDRALAVYDRMVSSSTRIVDKLQTKFCRDLGDACSSVSNNAEDTSAESWGNLLARYDCHIALTVWMSDLFKQLVPVEKKAAGALQKAVKLDRSATKTFDAAGLASVLSRAIELHGLLTVNVTNPIVRTLKFSKDKQERMRKELTRTLEETRETIREARVRVNGKADTPEEHQDEEERGPVRCDSMTSSEASETDNNEAGHDAVENLKEVEEQAHLLTLERKLVLQTQEMGCVLKQTSFLAVKTMELVLQDHLKHVEKALTSLTESLLKESTHVKQTVDDDKIVHPWDHITKMLSIRVAENSMLEDDANDRARLCEDSKSRKLGRRRRNRRKQVGSNVAHSYRPVLFGHSLVSAFHIALSLVCWAAVAAFKFARARMPSSVEERVVIAVFGMIFLLMACICAQSSCLQSSWSELAAIRSSNSEGLAEIVKLSLGVCSQQADV